MGHLQWCARVGVGTGEVKWPVLTGGPPAGFDGVVYEVLTGSVPFDADGGLVGDGVGSGVDRACCPPMTGGLDHPGFAGVGYKIGIVIGALLDRAAGNAGSPLAVCGDQLSDGGDCLLRCCCAFQPEP